MRVREKRGLSATPIPPSSAAGKPGLTSKHPPDAAGKSPPTFKRGKGVDAPHPTRRPSSTRFQHLRRSTSLPLTRGTHFRPFDHHARRFATASDWGDSLPSILLPTFPLDFGLVRVWAGRGGLLAGVDPPKRETHRRHQGGAGRLQQTPDNKEGQHWLYVHLVNSKRK